jgi:hypothetical protein
MFSLSYRPIVCFLGRGVHWQLSVIETIYWAQVPFLVISVSNTHIAGAFLYKERLGSYSRSVRIGGLNFGRRQKGIVAKRAPGGHTASSSPLRLCKPADFLMSELLAVAGVSLDVPQLFNSGCQARPIAFQGPASRFWHGGRRNEGKLTTSFCCKNLLSF